MYLVISDYRLSMNPRDFFRKENWLEEIKAVYPQYMDLQADDVDEILLYSSKRDDNALLARTVACADYNADEDYLRIVYGEATSDSEVNCEFVKKNVYALLRRKGLLKQGEFAPPVLYIGSIQDYKYIKNGPMKSVAVQNLLDKLTGMVTDNNWIGIVKSCPRVDMIEQDEIWNDVECLGNLAFALGKLATKNIKKPTPQQLKQKKEDGDFFLKVNSRCMELEPCISRYKSTLAYFLYDRYKANYDEEDYEEAKQLYEDLIESSPFSFKEKYRYANLLRKHYENPKNQFKADSYKEFNQVIAQYDLLLPAYDDLNDEEKQKQRNNYLKALYQYVSLQYDKTFDRYWNLYFDNQFSGAPIPDYLINNYSAEMIQKCDDYIRTVEGMIPEKPTPENVNDKPGYLDVHYREAQLSMAKAFLLRLRNYPTERYMPYFEEAEKELSTLIEQARELRDQGAHFVFPHYMKPPLAICYYFANKPEECAKCFGKKDQPWIRFEQARLLLLYGDFTQATELLESIPENDYCRNKADDLLEKIKERQ